MIGRTLQALGLTSALLVAATVAVLAQTTAPAPQADTAPGKTARPMAACRADLKALCGTVPRGGGAKMKCLVENRAKASAECQAVMATLSQRNANGTAAKQARLACLADAQALCATVEKGRGRVMRCLRDNQAKVAPACAEALAALPLRKRDRKP
jgi:hypothetical protein